MSTFYRWGGGEGPKEKKIKRGGGGVTAQSRQK